MGRVPDDGVIGRSKGKKLVSNAERPIPDARCELYQIVGDECLYFGLIVFFPDIEPVREKIGDRQTDAGRRLHRILHDYFAFLLRRDQPVHDSADADANIAVFLRCCVVGDVKQINRIVGVALGALDIIGSLDLIDIGPDKRRIRLGKAEIRLRNDRIDAGVDCAVDLGGPAFESHDIVHFHAPVDGWLRRVMGLIVHDPHCFFASSGSPASVEEMNCGTSLVRPSISVESRVT